MGDQVAAVSWKKLYVHLSGKTNGAHRGWVENLRCIGQTEVSSHVGSDYILVFCPIVSRVGTDIGEALESVEARFKDDKPIILVVMHHTFNPDHVLAESRRLVSKHNVRLIVDCLFHENKLLQCHRNDVAWSEVKAFLGDSQKTGLWQRCRSCLYVMLTDLKNIPYIKTVAVVMTATFFYFYFWRSKSPSIIFEGTK